MRLLSAIDTNITDEPIVEKPSTDRLISGDPTFKTWAIDHSHDGMVRTGIWEATTGLTRSIKGNTFEFCHILEGIVELTEDGCDPVIFKAGDSFIMKPGYTGNWKTIETVKKIYVSVTPR